MGFKKRPSIHLTGGSVLDLIKVRNAAGDAAEEMPWNGICFLSYFGGCDFVFSLFSYKNGFITNFDALDCIDIDHDLVHGHATQDGAALALDENGGSFP